MAMDPRRRRVSEIMRREVATLAPDERLDLAEDIMRLGRVRHMPVVDGDKLVGMVSQRDLLAVGLTKMLDFDARQRRAFMRSVQVSETMSREVVAIVPDATLAEAAERMLKRRVHALPVVERDAVMIGLVTDTDLLDAAFGSADAGESVELEGGHVSELRDRLQEDLNALRRMRDELRVQAHLGASEAKEAWERLEKKWAELEAKARLVAREAEEPIRDVGDAARKLIDEIRGGYEKLRRTL